MSEILNPQVLAELSDRGMAICNEWLKAKLELVPLDAPLTRRMRSDRS
jgi:hypothetical protein